MAEERKTRAHDVATRLSDTGRQWIDDLRADFPRCTDSDVLRACMKVAARHPDEVIAICRARQEEF